MGKKIKKIRRINLENQSEFSSLLFDTLFGLILFFNIDSFLEIKDPLHFIFYTFSFLIIVHWWFEIKATLDSYGDEITKTIAHTMIGMVLIISLDIFVLLVKNFEVATAIFFLITVFLLDIIWCLIFLYIGKWGVKDQLKILMMETELANNLKCDLIAVNLFVVLFILVPTLGASISVAAFIMIYSFYIYLTYHYKIIDIPVI